MKGNEISISHKTGILSGKVEVPASKSISNRALIIRNLSGKDFRIGNLSASGDTVLLQDLLEIIENSKTNGIRTTVDAGNAGTAYRFLTALLSVKAGKWELTGDDRMKERPVSSLVSALRQIGATIDYAGREGFPPLFIDGKIPEGDTAEISGSISSQFISALLMIAPTLPGGLKLKIKGGVVSMPYLFMTLRMMAMFGVKCLWDGDMIEVPHQTYIPGDIKIEADWSSASYWYALAALSKRSEILIRGLRNSSLQGDARVQDIFQKLGVDTFRSNEGMLLKNTGKVTTEPEVDFTSIPDLAQTVIAAAAALNTGGVFSGLKNLKHKETDRVTALATELDKAGFRLHVRNEETIFLEKLGQTDHDSLKAKRITVETYGDHRMALAFAPLALFFQEVSIKDPAVVDKSYPDFWQQLMKVGFSISE